MEVISVLIAIIAVTITLVTLIRNRQLNALVAKHTRQQIARDEPIFYWEVMGFMTEEKGVNFRFWFSNLGARVTHMEVLMDGARNHFRATFDTDEGLDIFYMNERRLLSLPITVRWGEPPNEQERKWIAHLESPLDIYFEEIVSTKSNAKRIFAQLTGRTSDTKRRIKP